MKKLNDFYVFVNYISFLQFYFKTNIYFILYTIFKTKTSIYDLGREYTVISYGTGFIYLPGSKLADIVGIRFYYYYFNVYVDKI